MAYDFNGTDQRVTPASPPVTAWPYTMNCWFNANDTTSLGALITLTRTTPGYSAVYVRGDLAGDPVQILVQGAGTAEVATTSGYSANTWNNACAAFASTTSRTVYLNGGSSATNTALLTSPVITTMNIASFETQANNWFAGRIAEAAIWNVALTDAEIASLAKGFKPTRIRPQSLVFYAPLVRNRYDLKGSLALAVNGNLGRVNLLTYSEQFDNAAWTLVNATLTNNAAVAPDGTTTAEKWITNNSIVASNAFVRQDATCAASTQYTASLYVKAAGQNSVNIRFITRETSGGTFIGDQQIIVNLTDGTYTTTSAGTPPTSASFNVSSVGNGWYRASITATTNFNALGLRLAVANDVTGNGTDGVFVWGAQLEQASSASDYQKIAAATDYQPVGSAITAHPRVY